MTDADPLAKNKALLHLMALQPAGKAVNLTHVFPSTAEDFSLLKSLGADRQFKELHIHRDGRKPYTTTGVSIIFKNGKTILLGAKGTGTNTAALSRKACAVEITKTNTNSNGSSIWIRFYDD